MPWLPHIPYRTHTQMHAYAHTRYFDNAIISMNELN